MAFLLGKVVGEKEKRERKGMWEWREEKQTD